MTAAEELVPRLTQAGCPEALPVLVEVFEAEAEARRQRRVTRLRRALRLPPGKTFATLDTGRFPAPVAQRLETLATGTSLRPPWARTMSPTPTSSGIREPVGRPTEAGTGTGTGAASAAGIGSRSDGTWSQAAGSWDAKRRETALDGAGSSPSERPSSQSRSAPDRQARRCSSLDEGARSRAAANQQPDPDTLTPPASAKGSALKRSRKANASPRRSKS